MNYVAGHVTNPDTMDSVIGVEYDEEINQIVAYIDQEEIGLTYIQAHQLAGLLREAINTYAWRNATYVYASEGLSMSTKHIMRMSDYSAQGTCLCGRKPTHFALITGWKAEPIMQGISRDRRNKWTGGTCQRCLAKYDKEHGNG